MSIFIYLGPSRRSRSKLKWTFLTPCPHKSFRKSQGCNPPYSHFETQRHWWSFVAMNLLKLAVLGDLSPTAFLSLTPMARVVSTRSPQTFPLLNLELFQKQSTFKLLRYSNTSLGGQPSFRRIWPRGRRQSPNGIDELPQDLDVLLPLRVLNRCDRPHV